MAQPRVEEHETIQVRIEWVEYRRRMQRVVVFHERTNLHLVADASFDYGSEGVLGRALGEREFGVPPGHALGADEY